jgi:pyridoxal phosphate enzyme (YggS family)
MAPVADQLSNVILDIRKAEAEYGRPEGAVTLIAVSKTFEADAIRPALEAGHRVFGENRVQEAMGKWPELRGSYDGIELHLIGPLQSNKAKEAVATFDVIHTVDRQKIAKALKAEMDKQGRDLPCFIQVNTGEEPQKAGMPPKEVDQFVKECKDTVGLNIVGLMCIPPVDEAPGSILRFFRESLRATACLRSPWACHLTTRLPLGLAQPMCVSDPRFSDRGIMPKSVSALLRSEIATFDNNLTKT